jgi:hypothetical protein
MPEHLGLTTPIACSLGALTPAERERQAQLRRQLEAAVAERQETAAGYRFVYRAEPGVAEAAAAWIAIERRCCPFLDFTLEWRAGQEGPSLELAGRPGVKAFIADTFL